MANPVGNQETQNSAETTVLIPEPANATGNLDGREVRLLNFSIRPTTMRMLGIMCVVGSTIGPTIYGIMYLVRRFG